MRRRGALRGIALLVLLVGCGDDGGEAATADAGVGADAAGPSDGALTPDAVSPDAAAPDAGFPPEDPCGRAAGGDPDADRIVVVGFPFGAEVGVHGTEIGSFVLSADGGLVETGVRVDLGGRPTQIAVLPSGRFALVLDEGGALHSVALSVDALTVVDTIVLPEAGWNDLVVDPSGVRAHVMRADGSPEGGIYTVEIECDGLLRYEDQFYALRLADALALLPDDPNAAVVLGGQAVFEPIDDRDVRLMTYDEIDGWAETGAFDVFSDFIDNVGIAISGDGAAVVIPNGSAFSEEFGHVVVASVAAPVTEVARFTGLTDARQARFAPDGVTALVSRLEPGRVAVLYDDGNGWDVVDEVAGVGVAEQLAVVHRGAAAGIVLAPGVDPNDGPQIVVLKVVAPGVVERLDTLRLGAGAVRIPHAIGVAP